MKRLMIVYRLLNVALLIVLLTANIVMGEEGFVEMPTFENIVLDENLVIRIGMPPPTSNIVIQSPDGRVAIIDFGGDKIVYNGDLPVDESAEIFFEALGMIHKEEAE